MSTKPKPEGAKCKHLAMAVRWQLSGRHRGRLEAKQSKQCSLGWLQSAAQEGSRLQPTHYGGER